jgi:hypothetical protein
VTLAGTAAAPLVAGYELYYGGMFVVAKKQAGVFTSEYAAYDKALNRIPVPPIASIDGGERVAVLWDTYGKDYCACYVRTSNAERGWVLCTSLGMETH